MGDPLDERDQVTAALSVAAEEARAYLADLDSRAVLGATAAGVRTPDLGGHMGTTEFTDDVIARVRSAVGT